MRNLTAEQMEKMPDLSWIKNSLKKDDSIIEKASKQKFYDIVVTYGDGSPVKNTGIWATSSEEAKKRYIFKHYSINILDIEVVEK